MKSLFPTQSDAVTLLNWFARNAIPYPWSAYNSDTPVDSYKIWVSEVMLQQTTVSAVLPRYRHWMTRFPDMQSLAEASQEEVYREWEGLGYYNRARNLHSTARESCARYGGQLPRNMDDLQSLPGVGNYIAAAVSSFAWHERTATADANTRRIVQRIEATDTWTRELEEGFKNRLEQVMPKVKPGRLNAALIQYGQQLCLSRKPLCTDCLLSHRCGAMQTRRQENIPVRKRQKVIHKKTELAILMNGQQIWLVQRTSGIGAGLWVFPEKSILIHPENWNPSGQLETVVHAYTRYRDMLIPCLYKVHKHTQIDPTPDGKWVKLSNIDKYAMPSAYRKIADMLN